MADTKINGALFQSMVTEGALAITEQKEQINELNVFPVPDGDTGTNMSMTMTAAMNELAKLSEPTLAKAAVQTDIPESRQINDIALMDAATRVLSCRCCSAAWRKNCARPRRRTAAIWRLRCARA